MRIMDIENRRICVSAYAQFVQQLRGGLARLVLGVSLVLCAAVAQADVLFEKNFADGLGTFSAFGNVSTSSSGARMTGSNGSDGAITSGPISTQGFTGIRLSFDRVTSGLDSGEAGIAEVSPDGVNFTRVEAVRSASGRITFNLGTSAENQAQLRLRFRIYASLSSESYTVNNILLEGSAGGGEPPPSGNPFQRGPDPTVSSLQATSGPFAVATQNVSSSVSGFGGGTIYYPTTTSEGPFAAIAVVPGYFESQSAINWWGPRLASHGFVVITINTNSTSDQPASRATQLMAALNHVVNLSKTASNAIYGKVDANRLGVMGHSMGGGGTLIAARDNPSLKAAIPFAPWNSSTTNFSAIRVPTMIIACESDTVAAVSQHALPFYNSIPSTVSKAYPEINNGSHSCANSGNSNTATLGKYGVSWMKRFMDNDTRYSPFLCGAPHQAVLGTTVFSRYLETCPY